MACFPGFVPRFRKMEFADRFGETHQTARLPQPFGQLVLKLFRCTFFERVPDNFANDVLIHSDFWRGSALRCARFRSQIVDWNDATKAWTCGRPRAAFVELAVVEDFKIGVRELPA